MKNKNLLFILWVGLAILMAIPTGCKKDDDDKDDKDDGSLTITLLSPTIPGTGKLTPAVGDVIVFKLALHAEAGLSEIKVGTTRIQAYYDQTDDTVEYQTLIRNDDDQTLVFELIDANSKSKLLDPVVIDPLPGDLGLLLIDFGGKMTASAPWDGNDLYADDWDKRTVYTFDVVGDVSDEGITQIPNDEATLTFKADNPDGEGKVFKMVKTVYLDTLGGQCQNPWGGGWVHQIIDLGALLPSADVQGVADGNKVIKMDVYYDATVTNTYVMDSITTMVDRYGATQPWGADVTQGYLLVCILANAEKHMAAQKAYDNDGYFISMKGYFLEENQWTTVEFDQVDTDRSTKWDPTNPVRALANEVDMVHFIVSGGYEGVTGNKPNLNPIYFKNLRIADAE